MNTFEPENTAKELHPGWICLQRLVDWFDCCFATYSPLPDTRRDIDPWRPHQDPGFVETQTARESRKHYLANPENERVYQPRLFVAIAALEFCTEQHRQVEEFYQRQLAAARAATAVASNEASRLRDEKNQAMAWVISLALFLNRHKQTRGASELLENMRKMYGNYPGFPPAK